MRQTHVAGEKLFVDWTGDAIPVFDPITGAEHGARIFVAARPVKPHLRGSTLDRALSDWIDVSGLAAIGGVPKAVVCDNLKAGVNKASRYEPGINRSYQDFVDDYRFVLLPTRARKPSDRQEILMLRERTLS